MSGLMCRTLGTSMTRKSLKAPPTSPNSPFAILLLESAPQIPPRSHILALRYHELLDLSLTFCALSAMLGTHRLTPNVSYTTPAESYTTPLESYTTRPQRAGQLHAQAPSHRTLAQPRPLG